MSVRCANQNIINMSICSKWSGSSTQNPAGQVYMTHHVTQLTGSSDHFVVGSTMCKNDSRLSQFFEQLTTKAKQKSETIIQFIFINIHNKLYMNSNWELK